MSKTMSGVGRRILTVPDDTAILRTKSAPIARVDKKVVGFLSDLGATLRAQRKPAGVGLSAVQVGKTIRAFATLLPEEAPVVRSLSSEASSLAPESVATTGFWRTSDFSSKEKSGPSKKPELIFYINPEIVDHSNDMTFGEDINPYNEDLEPDETPKPFLEGCLSIPHVYGPVKRWSWIMAKAIVLSENQLLPSSKFKVQSSKFRLDYLSARVFQHEIDHLNGILFTDRTLAEGNQLYREINKELEPVEF